MELSEYQRKFGAPKPAMIVTCKYSGKEIKGVLVIREEDKGIWELSEIKLNQ